MCIGDRVLLVVLIREKRVETGLTRWAVGAAKSQIEAVINLGAEAARAPRPMEGTGGARALR